VPKIFINPGHGQKNNGVFDPGAIGPSGLREADVVADIGRRLEEKMKRNGWETLLCQDGDLWDVSSRSNNWTPDYFISIHANSVVNKTAHGIETLIQGAGGTAEKIAKEVQKELVKTTGLADRGVKVQNNHVTRETIAPAILVEVGFISNPKEESLLKTEEFREKVAEAIFRGFVKGIGEEIKVAEKSLKERLANDDTYLTVRVRESKVEEAIKEINKLGYAAKRLDLA